MKPAPLGGIKADPLITDILRLEEWEKGEQDE